MKHLIFLILTITFSTAVFGQQNKIDFGVEGGPNLIFLRGNDIIKQNHKPTFGFSGGLSFQYNFQKIFSIRTGIAFERKGSVINNNTYYTDQLGNIIGSGKYIVHFNFDYLTLPLIFRVSVGNKIKYFFNSGFFFSYLVKQTNISEANIFFPKTTTDNISRDKRFDTGITAGLGLSIPIKNKFILSFEIRDNLGLYNVSKGPTINDGTIKTNSTNLLVGLAYKFGARQTVTK